MEQHLLQLQHKDIQLPLEEVDLVVIMDLKNEVYVVLYQLFQQ